MLAKFGRRPFRIRQLSCLQNDRRDSNPDFLINLHPDDCWICPKMLRMHFFVGGSHLPSMLHATVVERWSLTGELSMSCDRPAADG